MEHSFRGMMRMKWSSPLSNVIIFFDQNDSNRCFTAAKQITFARFWETKKLIKNWVHDKRAATRFLQSCSNSFDQVALQILALSIRYHPRDYWCNLKPPSLLQKMFDLNETICSLMDGTKLVIHSQTKALVCRNLYVWWHQYHRCNLESACLLR